MGIAGTIILGFVAFLVVLLSIAMTEYVISNFFGIEVGLTVAIAESISWLFDTIIKMVGSPFYAIAAAIEQATVMLTPVGYALVIGVVVIGVGLMGYYALR